MQPNNNQGQMNFYPIQGSKVEYVRGIGKKSGKPYRAIKVTIGEYEKMDFEPSKFEMDYIEKLAITKNSEKVHDDTHSPDTSPKETISLDDENDSNDWINKL